MNVRLIVWIILLGAGAAYLKSNTGSHGGVMVADVDLGNVSPNQLLDISALLVNNSDSVVGIEDIQAGCGCLSLTSKRESKLPPHKSMPLAFALKTPDAYGVREIKVMVRLSNAKPATKAFKIRYRVHEDLKVIPNRIVFLNDNLDRQPATKTFLVKSTEQNLNLTSVTLTSPLDFIKFSTEIQGPQLIRGVVTFAQNLHIYGEFSSEIRILVNTTKGPFERTIALGGEFTNKSNVIIEPKYLSFGSSASQLRPDELLVGGKIFSRVSGVDLKGGLISLDHNSAAFRETFAARLDSDTSSIFVDQKAHSHVAINGSVLVRLRDPPGSMLFIPVYLAP